jgi:hypothetical protein
MPDNSPYKRTADELLQILLNKTVVKEGEYDCTLNSDREHCTIRFEPSLRSNDDREDERKDSETER